MGEMGVHVEHGELAFVPEFMCGTEFLSRPKEFHCWDVKGNPKTVRVPEGTMAFTYCQVPVVAHRVGPPHIRVTFADGSSKLVDGLKLDAAMSSAVFERLGAIQQLDVFYGLQR
jgi:hypothetical protein